MATTVDLTQLDAVIKELYPSGVPEDLATKKHTLLRMMRKEGGWTGDNLAIPALYDYPGGRSADISVLLASTGPIGASKNVKFNVNTRAKDYAATWLDGEMMKAADGDLGSFVKGREYEISNMLKSLGNSAGHAIYRNGSGALGQIVAGETLTDANFTLANRGDAKHFRVGMQLAFAAAEVTGGLRTEVSVVTVTAVDESSGLITTDASNLTTAITSIAAGDYVYAKGDRNAKMKGLAAWIPLTAPVLGSDSFWGVDRGVQPNRLAGVRLNQPNYPIEDLFLETGETVNEQGGDPEDGFISHRRWISLAKRLNAKVTYQNGGGDMKSFGASFPIYLSSGIINIRPDSDCPDDRGYVLTMDSWRIRHLGDFPEIIRDDGLSGLRRALADAIEIRARYFAQPVCYAPGHNAVFALPSN